MTTTLNAVLKVAVYYCGLPNRRQAKRLLPWLHPAFDEPMMEHLQRQYGTGSPIGVKAIADVDKRSYTVLRNLAAMTPWRTSAAGSTPSSGRTSCGRR